MNETRTPPICRAILLSSAIMVAALLLATPQAAAAQPTTNLDEPSPGRVVVDAAALFMSCAGASTGLPTVVFENGLGVSYDTWRDVQPEIAKVTRACAYDRLGVGQSDPVAADDTRTPFEMARTLRALLGAAEIEGPVVLVGHSIAGFVLLAYPHLFPDNVSGLVFVDASHPQQWIRFRAADSTATAPPSVMGAERVDRRASTAELDAVGTFGDMPIAVVHQARPTDAPMRTVWLELQEDHAARSRNSRLIPGRDSGHYVHNDEPELVIEAVLWVLRGGT